MSDDPRPEPTSDHAFDQRWQALITVARQAPPQAAPLDDLAAARLAAHGIAQLHQQRIMDRQWSGMVAAAGLFLAILIGAGATAALFTDAPTTLRANLGQVANTSFIPAPPRPPSISATIAQYSPRHVANTLASYLPDYLTDAPSASPTTTPETTP